MYIDKGFIVDMKKKLKLFSSINNWLKMHVANIKCKEMQRNNKINIDERSVWGNEVGTWMPDYTSQKPYR